MTLSTEVRQEKDDFIHRGLSRERTGSPFVKFIVRLVTEATNWSSDTESRSPASHIGKQVPFLWNPPRDFSKRPWEMTLRSRIDVCWFFFCPFPILSVCQAKPCQPQTSVWPNWAALDSDFSALTAPESSQIVIPVCWSEMEGVHQTPNTLPGSKCSSRSDCLWCY